VTVDSRRVQSSGSLHLECKSRAKPAAQSSMRAPVIVIDSALAIYIWILFAAAILSWLVGFNVVSADNKAVVVIDGFISRLTGPARRPVRYLLPDLGGIDLSPIVLIAIIILARYAIAIYVLPELY
jgi:YggT family protein